MLKNRICNYCGREYYVCRSCISINSWKNICCSVRCFRELMKEDRIEQPKKINDVEKGENMSVLLRAGLNNKDTINIVGYDLELGKFDCSDSKTRTYDDFSYFIVPKNELKEIVSYFEDRIKELEFDLESSKRKKTKNTEQNIAEIE